MPLQGLLGKRSVPYYDLVANALPRWEENTKISGDMIETLRDGIIDEPVDYVYGLPEMPPIPQDAKSLDFGEEDLREGLLPENQFYRQMTAEDVARVRASGKLISTAFTAWREKDGVEEGRFVICLNRQSKFFKRRYTRMERITEFAAHVKHGDRMISFDIKSGYRHLKLHPSMVDYFAFHYNGKYYQCLACPFGWGPCSYWFTRFLAPVITIVRSWGYLVLVYLDDVLVIPNRWRVATKKDCIVASAKIGNLLKSLGITRHPSKGCWGDGSQVLTHLGFVFDTIRMMFCVPEEKQAKIRKLSKSLLREARLGRRWVSVRDLSKFLGKSTSLMLAVPLARFYNRALYKSLNGPWRRIGRKLRTRLSAQAIRDLGYWKSLDHQGRPMQPPTPTMTMHSDASDLGWGGTISRRGALDPGSPGEVSLQGIWTPEEQSRTIMWRELKGMILTIERAADEADAAGRGPREWVTMRCYQDNSSCRYIVQNMCTASEEAMPLLRRLKRLLEVRRVGLRSAVDPIRSQPTRGPAQQVLGPMRPSAQSSRIALAEKLVHAEASSASVSIPSFQSPAPNFPAQNNNGSTLPRLVRRSGTPSESSSGYDFSDPVQTSARRRERSISDPRLAEADLVSSSPSDEPRMVPFGDESSTSSGREASHQQTLADGSGRSEYDSHRRRSNRFQAASRPTRSTEGVQLRLRLSPELRQSSPSGPSKGIY